MNRRQFLAMTGLTVGSSLVLVMPPALASARRQKVHFYVAGVRFHPVIKIPGVGDQLAIKQRTFRGEKCYAVLTKHGEQIGWVPRSLAEIHDFDLNDSLAYFSKVDTYALPWKRYQVSVRSRMDRPNSL